ncbi:MAG: hypothetical protein ABUK01_10505 [Leptospirales bacterium]
MNENAKKFQQNLKTVAKGKKGSRDMTRDEARFCLTFVFSDEVHPVQAGALFTAMRFKGSTEEELHGFLDALENGSDSILVKAKTDSEMNPLFTANSPYDGRTKSLNLSVAASLVCAASGVPVLLHSSTGLPPKKGVTAAPVLERLGIPVMLSGPEVAQNVETKNFGFIHASQFNYPIEKLRRWREILLYRTILHTLEVLNNPGRAKKRIIGVAHDHLAGKFARIAAARGAEHVLVFPGLDGADELAMQKTVAVEVKNGQESKITLDPKEYGFSYSDKFDPENANTAAKITEEVLQGEGEKYIEAVIYNAGIRIYVAKNNLTIQTAMDEAREVLKSGRAHELLNCLRGPNYR